MSLTIDKTGSPIKITGTTNAKEVIFDNNVFVKFIYWLNPTTIGDLCVLKGKDSREIASLRCEVAAQSQIFPVWTKCGELNCDDLDSGTLYIYFS